MTNDRQRGRAVRGPAVTLVVLLALVAAVRWGTVALEQGLSGSTSGLPRNPAIGAGDVLTALKTLLLVRIVATLVSVVVAVAALVVHGVWVARAYANTDEAAPGRRRVRPAVTVVACVLPAVGMFVLPFVYDDLGRAAGIRRRVLPLVAAWWALLVAAFLVFFTVQVDVDPRRADYLAPVVQGDMLMAGLTTGAAAALAAVVLVVSARQEAWRRGAVPPAGAVTPR